MRPKPKTIITQIITSTFATLILGAVLLFTPTDTIAVQSSSFRGGEPEISQTPNVTSIRMLFSAGARTSWNTHCLGDPLMIEEGIGLHQTRGRIIEEINPGKPCFTMPLLKSGMVNIQI